MSDILTLADKEYRFYSNVDAGPGEDVDPVIQGYYGMDFGETLSDLRVAFLELELGVIPNE